MSVAHFTKSSRSQLARISYKAERIASQTLTGPNRPHRSIRAHGGQSVSPTLKLHTLQATEGVTVLVLLVFPFLCTSETTSLD